MKPTVFSQVEPARSEQILRFRGVPTDFEAAPIVTIRGPYEEVPELEDGRRFPEGTVDHETSFVLQAPRSDDPAEFYVTHGDEFPNPGYYLLQARGRRGTESLVSEVVAVEVRPSDATSSPEGA